MGEALKRAHFCQAGRRRRNKKLFRVGGHKRCRIKSIKEIRWSLETAADMGEGAGANAGDSA